ncbi:hypothetical protein HQ535_13610, partial [bacterium]|nr:hypothetical protein [bacterium]
AVPEGLRIVVAHSGDAAAKTGSVRDAYDLRVVGCRMAAALLGDHSYAPRLGRVAGAPTDGLPETATPLQVSAATGVAPGAFVGLSAGPLPDDAIVPVAACARHVLSEAVRVDLAERALLRGDREALGALLDASHRSLQDFGVSSVGLDEVVVALRAGGAFGARLTGAGFGGYAVAVVPPRTVQAVMDAAASATGGPAFEVRPAQGLRLV